MTQELLDMLDLFNNLIVNTGHTPYVSNRFLFSSACKATKHGYAIQEKYGAIYFFPVTYKITCSDRFKFKLSFTPYHIRSAHKSNLARVIPNRDELDLFFTEKNEVYTPIIPNAAIRLTQQGRMILQEKGHVF